MPDGIHWLSNKKYFTLRIANVDELETHLIDEWADFDQSIVDAAIGQWRNGLSNCVSMAHFEHQLGYNKVKQIII